MFKIKELLKNTFRRQKGQPTKHQQLAVDIAKDFNDMAHIGIYMRVCNIFSDSYIRHKWAITKEANPTNPGAYFTKIVYGRPFKS